MPAYLFVLNKITDMEAFQAKYPNETVPLIKKFGGKFVLRTETPEYLEGPEDMRGALIGVMEFPDMNAVRRFWNGPEYEEVKKLRYGTCDVIAFGADEAWLTEEQSDALMKQLVSG